jgi:hypothetical protein
MTIGNSVTYIGNNAFSDCSNIKYLTYNSKSYLNSYFTNFTNLTKVTLGDSVEIIGDKAFAGCTKLSSVRIGRMVSSIGTNAFNDCTGLFDMYSYIISPANVKLGTTAFGASINRCVLHVLKGAERIYSTTDQWKKFFISEDLSLASSDYEIKMTVEGSGVYSVLKYAGGATFSMSAAAETGYEVGSVKLDGVEQGSGNISFTVNANHSIVITPKSTNGLAKVEATKNMTCWVSDGKVFVSSSSQLDGVTVYDMGGRIIAKSTIKDYIYTIPIKTDTDAVIVKSGSESVRILVK